MADYNDFAFEMWRGDSESIAAAITVSGVAVDITNASLRFTAKRALTDTDANAVFTRTIGTGITVTNAIGGLATIALIPANTLSLTVPTLLYCDFQLQDVPGNVSTLTTGTILVKLDVSQTAP
jgi:hypothetical protein